VHAEDEERCADGAGAHLDRLDRDLTLVGSLTPEQRQRLLEIADRCPVHRTLSAGVRITTQLHGSVADHGDRSDRGTEVAAGRLNHL
jgi:putative redox protein